VDYPFLVDTNLLYESPGYLRVLHAEELDCAIFEWEDFSIPLASLARAHELALDRMTRPTSRGRPRYIADCMRARETLRAESITWWRDVWTPRLVAAGTSLIVSIEPLSTLAAIASKDWQRKVLGGGLRIIHVAGRREAEEAIARDIADAENSH
jgi:hypothetical protein